ncbi:centromere protein Q isoform X4 [Erpetoichthys calabaricus]|uniref:Centromere protein Q n=2 Tax=Erpetoichthys calabaricus TaxID=27687 RepID=A0A8C4TC36_ERPCA|nr:centromere protein Q isoform X3 [Erpetoichthys calabaricus]XP_051781845.1 centromere protein Q isoform X4 [Erpetoichthys calabaricus]
MELSAEGMKHTSKKKNISKATHQKIKKSKTVKAKEDHDSSEKMKHTSKKKNISKTSHQNIKKSKTVKAKEDHDSSEEMKHISKKKNVSKTSHQNIKKSKTVKAKEDHDSSEEDVERVPDSQSSEAQTKKKASTTAPRSRKKGKQLKHVSQTTKDYLSSTFDYVVLSVIVGNQKNATEVQEHFRIMKDRFFNLCSKLMVPPDNLGNLNQTRHWYFLEKQKLNSAQEMLQTVEADCKKVFDTLEDITGKNESLEEKIRILRDQLEELESESQEILQSSENTELHLPPLPARSFTGPTLQEEMSDIQNPQEVLQLLNAVQGNTGVQDMLAFLAEAQSIADKL